MKLPELTQLARLLLDSASTDVVPFSAIPWEIRQMSPDATEEEVRARSMYVLNRILEHDDLLIGEFVIDSDTHWKFKPWSTTPLDSARRVEAEWNKIGRDPDPGEIAWLANRVLLPIHARMP